ncbi:MAG: hypothetical protein NUV56_01615, partial [Candidatus Uhrbacteria bacterium]|nr:hypothetical protein [Candidatus Uhrbacteria bacterium]
ILKRFRGSDEAPDAMAGGLLKDLVWAKYLPNKTVPLSLANGLTVILRKYERLFSAAEHSEHRERLTSWLLDASSTEIEYTLAPPMADEALASFMYEEMRGRIDWDPRLQAKPEERDLRLFIAIHKILLKSNIPTLRFRVLTLYYPLWAGTETPEDLVDQVSANLPTVIATIEREIAHPMTERLSRLLRRRAGIFRVLREALDRDHAASGDLLTDPAALDSAVSSALRHRTQDFKVRLRRTVVRAVAFLFITKMLLALIIEIPYDLLFSDSVPIYPLLVNIFFHPFFLALISLTVVIPEKKNTEDYIAAVRALAVGADHPLLHLRVKHEVRSAWSDVFTVLYVILFVAVYSAIGSLLHTLGFHWLSIALFLFFLSLVTFFGIRIRSSVRDIVASDARSGIIGTAFDMLMLPIVRAGSWLSNRVAKINVFIYFFDFIIEAPLKVAIEFVESWLTFVREKKEEI